MRPLGSVQSPKPDGITGTFLTGIQPALGPTLKEREKTYGEPIDEAKVRGNLGIAYVSQEIGRRRSHSTQTLIVTGETGGRATESPFQSQEVDSDESEDLRATGISPKVEVTLRSLRK